MKEEKHNEILREVLDEIESASKDKRGLVSHQRRLAFSLSLGAVTILEIYLHKLNVIKESSKINHIWFKKKKQTILEYLQNQITSSLNSIENMQEIISLIIKIEEKRDDLAYGSPSTEENIQEKINFFFKLKNLAKC
ncbi:MAG: hypothetical protein Q8N63_02420 [Nanoarchaeota archaeon]|nr:hypothetical protein [Nanoarchaeota archaeon]